MTLTERAQVQSNVVEAIPQGWGDADGGDATTALESLVPELVALTLNAKQVHWNVTGPGFLPLHTLTDELASDVAEWSDSVAERVMAVGSTVDARPSTVASTEIEIRSGRIQDYEAAVALIEIVDRVSDSARKSLAALERRDPVGHDMTVEILGGLDKYRWMLRARLAGRSSFRVEIPGWSPASRSAQNNGSGRA